MMQKLPKIGLPALLLGFILIVFVSKSSINIGYGEAGVLFIITAIMVIPSLIFLFMIRHKLKLND